MSDSTPPITLEQLAQIYAARNRANSDMSKALRAKPRDQARIDHAVLQSRGINGAYEACKKQYKREQKAAKREELYAKLHEERLQNDCKNHHNQIVDDLNYIYQLKSERKDAR